MRQIQLYVIELGKSLRILMSVNLYDANRYKFRHNGIIEKYVQGKACGQGIYLEKGEDYFDSYSLIAWLSIILVLLSLTLLHGINVHQTDVKTTFLNRQFKEEIYMNHPNGFIVDS